LIKLLLYILFEKYFTAKNGQPRVPALVLCAAEIKFKERLNTLISVSDAFSALTLLVGHQEGHPACKKLSGGVLAWLSVCSEVQTCIWPA